MGKTVLDTTPDRLSSTTQKAAGQSTFNLMTLQDTNGRILKGTLLCDTHNVQDIIGCLGGIKVLFPLFVQMDQLSRSTESPDELDPYLTMELITLIHDMLRDHPDNQDDILRSRGFTIINHLLRQVSPQHLTLQTVRAIFNISKTIQQNEALYNDILQNLLLEFKLWIYAPPEVQQYIIKSFISETGLDSATMRKLIGVQRVLDILRWFYWFNEDPYSNMGKETICNPMTGAPLGKRPNAEDTRKIRGLLLSLIKAMVGNTITLDEVNAILNFLLNCSDSGQLVDMLQMLFELMFTGGSNLAIFEHLFNSNGLDILVSLLSNTDEQVRIIVLHCIGKLLKIHPKLLAKVQTDVSHGFVHITRALQMFPFTLQTYRALRNVLLGDVTLESISSQQDHTEFIAEKSHRFEVQSVLATIFTLLLNADINLRQNVVQDFVLLFKEKESRDIFLRQRGWQTRLFLLILPEKTSSPSPTSSPLSSPLSAGFASDTTATAPTPTDTTATPSQSSPRLLPSAAPEPSGDTDSTDIQAMAVRDMVVEIFKILVFHLLTTDKQGWRVLEETLAYVYIFHDRKLESVSFLSAFYRKLLDSYIVEFERGNISLPSSLESIKSGSGEKSSTAAIVLTNFVYLVRMIEEYLFYHHTICEDSFSNQTGAGSGEHSAILLSNSSVGSINALDTVSFSSAEGTDSVRLRKRIHSNALPPLNTVFADPALPGKSSPLASSRSFKPQLPATPTSQQHVVSDFGPSTELSLAGALQSGMFCGDVGSTPVAPNASSTSGSASALSAPPNSSSASSSSSNATTMSSLVSNASSSLSTVFHSNVYDAELELNRDPMTGAWIDLAIAERVLILFDKCHLISVANFQALGVLAQDAKKHLRQGGALRVALRLIRYALRESNEINERHIKCVHQIIKRDVEAEKERMRFSELWTVTGDTEEGDEFQNRLLYVLAFLFDTWARIVDCERRLTDESQRQQKQDQSEEMLKQIKLIFNDRKPMLMAELKNKEGKPLIRPDFVLFDTSKPRDTSSSPDSGRSADQTWNEIIQSPGWQEAYLHFKKAVLHVAKEEESFLSVITKRFKRVIKRIQDEIKTLDQAELDTERRFSAEIKKIRADRGEEQSRISMAISKYEESHRTAAHLSQQLWRNLSNERGPWSTSWSLEGEISDGTPVFWKLEVKLEDKMRRRIRLKRDYHGSSHPEATANQRGGPSTPVTIPSPSSFSQMKPGVLGMQLGLKKIISTSTRPDEEPIYVEEDFSSTGGPILTPEDEGDGMTSATGEEKKLHTVSCDLVTPMQAFSGRMDITTRSITWTPDETNKCVVHGRETVVKQYLKKPKDIKIAKEELRSIQFRRFRLEHLALEFFLMDDSSYFFSFGMGERLKAYKKILASKPPNLVQFSGLSPEELLKRTNLTSMWRNRMISNFEYLMQLNTISGRTYNDLSQYPIFPWIIADYESQTLDLTDPATFRDLSKPIGALNPDRLRELQLRCSQLDDIYTPKFLYGSFYSSPGITLYYLIRLEPFIKYAIVMQGGAFDVADRLFDSIGQTWRNCMTASSDVKELVPEFFYLPEFLVNRNTCDFGLRQTGSRVDDVVLPPWARTPEEFVHLNREALESEFVSEHLHEWIDLIWGFKQNGKEAWDADNYFFYLTYEHMVEQEKKKPEYDRNYVIASLDNYGQVPIQLFKRPHQKRLPIRECFNPYIDLRALPNMKARFIQPITTATARGHSLSGSSSSSSNISSYAATVGDSDGATPAMVIPGSAIVKICVTGDRLVTVSANGAVSINRFANTPTSSSSQSPLPFSFVIDPNVATRRLGIPFAQDMLITSNCFEVMGPSFSSGRASGETTIFSCAHWDPSFKCVALSQTPTTGTVIQSVWRHKDTVTCLALCEDNHTLVTGSRDTTIMVWDLVVQSDSRQPPIAPNPRHILFGHDDEVVCLAVRSDLDMVVSGSKDRTVIVHTLRQGRYVRTIRHPNKGRIDLVAIDDDGHIIMYSKDDLTLHAFTVNGTHLASVDTNERLHCMRVDGTFLVTGGEKRVVCVRRVFNLEVVERFDLKSEMAAMSMAPSSIRALFVTKEHPKLLLVGLADGSLVFFAAEMSVG